MKRNGLRGFYFEKLNLNYTAMKIKKMLGIAILAGTIATMIACNNEGAAPSIKAPTPEGFGRVRSAALKSITQTVTFNAEDGIDFTSEKGVRLFINPYQISLNGDPVTGPVTLEFIELYKKGDMLVVNKPLMGTALDGVSKGPMITGGQFYVNVTKDGQQIDQTTYYMTVPTENTGGFQSGMTIWRGEENENGDMTWQEVAGEEGLVDGCGGGVEVMASRACEGGDYNVLAGFFGWINIDILWDLPEPKTKIWIKVPNGFDNKNCAVYVVYKDQPGALAYMDQWDPEKKMFTEHYGLAPVGFNFYVVFVSGIEGTNNFIYAYKDVVVEEDKAITFEAGELKEITKSALIALINNL